MNGLRNIIQFLVSLIDFIPSIWKIIIKSINYPIEKDLIFTKSNIQFYGIEDQSPVFKREKTLDPAKSRRVPGQGARDLAKLG